MKIYCLLGGGKNQDFSKPTSCFYQKWGERSASLASTHREKVTRNTRRCHRPEERKGDATPKFSVESRTGSWVRKTGVNGGTGEIQIKPEVQ